MPSQLIKGMKRNAVLRDEPWLSARSAAEVLTISVAAFWKGVHDGRFPQPVYVMPRAPRWKRSELNAAVERFRMLPENAKAGRKAVREASEA